MQITGAVCDNGYLRRQTSRWLFCVSLTSVRCPLIASTGMHCRRVFRHRLNGQLRRVDCPSHTISKTAMRCSAYSRSVVQNAESSVSNENTSSRITIGVSVSCLSVMRQRNPSYGTRWRMCTPPASPCSASLRVFTSVVMMPRTSTPFLAHAMQSSRRPKHVHW